MSTSNPLYWAMKDGRLLASADSYDGAMKYHVDELAACMGTRVENPRILLDVGALPEDWDALRRILLTDPALRAVFQIGRGVSFEIRGWVTTMPTRDELVRAAAKEIKAVYMAEHGEISFWGTAVAAVDAVLALHPLAAEPGVAPDKPAPTWDYGKQWLADIAAERERAHAKHGDTSMESSPAAPDQPNGVKR